MTTRRQFALGLLAACAASPALARPHGWDETSPFAKWVAGLKQPDLPTASCCGKGDLYTIEIVEDALGNEGKTRGRARILDGSALVFPDGQKREPIPDGTEFTFPKAKVNPPQDGNPAKTALAFLSVYNEVIIGIYCVVPIPPGM